MISRLAPDQAALLVVDMQNGFCRPGGSLARIGFDVSELAVAIEPCRRLLVAARGAGLPVIHTRYVYAPQHSDGGLLVDALMPELKAHGALLAGSEDASIVDELVPAEGETVIDKNRPSAFFRTRLDAVLADLGVTQLVVCGVTTNCCVESTVRDAGQRDITTFVVADATGELEAERHAAALRTMSLLFGWVTDVASVETALGAKRAGA
jgi:ureidoacrylate peracid hydrolase